MVLSARGRYRKGSRKEYKVVHQEKDKCCIAFRSAGSHSPIDVVSIDSVNKVIKLIQCKSDKMPDSQKRRLEEQYNHLNDVFKCVFEVI